MPLRLALITLLTVKGLANAEDPVIAVCKKLIADHQDSIVSVTAVAKMTMSGSGTRSTPQETKMEAPGTIVDSSGLIVTSLARIDPSALMASMRRSGSSSFESTLQDVKVIMGDGTEIPAQIVLKDTDLDLAFVKPDTSSKEAKGITFQPISLTDSTKVVPGEGVIGLGRADESVGRVPGVRRDNVFTITKRPREFVIVSGDFMGSPVFSESGKFVGIGILRPGKSISRSSTAVVSADDVKDVVEQAKNAKPIPQAPKQLAAPKPSEKPVEEKKPEAKPK